MKDNNHEVPVLICQTGKLTGMRWILDKDLIVIGRSPECTFVIPDRQVSREHLELRRCSEGFMIKDLESKNGTYLNGVKVDKGEVLVQDGDVIQVAVAQKLIFAGTESTVPLSMEDAGQMGLGRMRMDSKARRVWVGDREIDPPISPLQFHLLELLYSNIDRVISRDEIAEYVWPESEGVGVSEQAIDALVRRLRERLIEADPDYGYIETVRGHGFRLNNPI